MFYYIATCYWDSMFNYSNVQTIENYIEIDTEWQNALVLFTLLRSVNILTTVIMCIDFYTEKALYDKLI